MKKFFFLLIFFFSNLYSQNQQVIFVLAPKLNSQTAKLVLYENEKQISKPITVNIGENGLSLNKKEGDKKSPIGIFNLEKIYTYHEKIDTKMPYKKSTKNHICIDDINSKDYNKILEVNDKIKYKSYEKMLLKNITYEYVITVDYNSKNVKNVGSCIFLHVENPKKKFTSGCTSMKKDDIKNIVSWLDKNKKPILIQIPKDNCSKLKRNYPFLDCSL